MKKLQSVRRFLSSMKFAVILLAILALACMAGSFITQGQTFEWYESAYSQKAAAAILFLGLDDVFHCWWFVVITAFLCLNLLLCNVLRLGTLLRRWRAQKDPAALLKKIQIRQAADPEDLAEVAEISSVLLSDLSETELFFRKMGFSRPVSNLAPDGSRYLFGYRFRIGLWGAWLCHLGVLILILGFGLGQMTKKEYTVYGVPGQTRPVEDTGYDLTINDFTVALREDDTVEQYTSKLTVTRNEDGDHRDLEVSVNHPASAYGMKYYQNSTGWAATVTVEKNGEILQSEVLCAGEALEVKDREGLFIHFSAFYPDFYMDETTGPMTLSGSLNYPGYLYRIYYQNRVIGMSVLTGDDVITIEEYTVIFSDPQSYTLIQIKTDRFTPVALIGGLLILVSLLLAFYCQPAQLIAVEGTDGSWQAEGECRRGGALFTERMNEVQKEIENGK